MRRAHLPLRPGAAGLWLSALLTLAFGGCQCIGGPGPDPGDQVCEADEDCRAGEICGEDGTCTPRPGCHADADCLADEQCRLVDGTCRLRPGFGRECEADTDCYPGFFCALGRCRDSDQAWVCARAVDCPLGRRCDREHFLCIEEVDCRLGEHFPEVTCDPEQACDTETGNCLFTGPSECTPANAPETCGPDEVCDAGGRCVQCVSDADCGPGLTCNSRAGRCESEDLCRNDGDCTAPLVCDPTVALCRVPLPPCDSDLDCAISEICNHVTGTCESVAGKCFDDRLEENDSPEGAYVVTLANGAVLLDELELCPDDDDYFAVELAAGDRLTAQVSDVEASAQVEISLIDVDGVTTLRHGDSWPRGDGTVSFTATIAGTYFVRLLSRAAPSVYLLQIDVTASQPCAADALEADGGNDTVSTATLLEAGAHTALTLCDGDVDHYRVALASGEGLRVSAVAEGDLDLDLGLFGADGVTLLTQGTTAGPLESVFYRGVEEQAVILRVGRFAGAAAGYGLTIEISPPYSCTADGYEGPDGNDEAALASAVGSIGISAAALSLCRTDEDWFRFSLEDFERFVAAAEFEPGDLDLDLEVYADEGGTLIAASRGGAGVEAVSIPAAGVATTLWLRVLAADGAVAPYTLSAFVEHGEVCVVDPDEPNDLPAQAATAPAAGQYSLCGFDEDYYALALAPGKRADAAITFSPAEGDLDLQLLHPDGVTQLATSDGVTGSEQLSFIAEVEGTHYVRVYSLTSDPLARYLLTIDVVD